MAIGRLDPSAIYSSRDAESESELKAQTVEKGRLEIDAYKKSATDKEAYAKSVKDILNEGASGKDTPTDAEPTKETPVEAKVSPTGSPMPSFMGGAKDEATAKEGATSIDEWTGKLKDLQAGAASKAKTSQQQGQQLQKLMMAAANNNNPTLALEFRKQIDGLDSKAKEAQTEAITLAGKQYEIQAQLGQGYLDNPTDEGWYKQVAESMRLGLPGAEALFNVPRDKREAVAKGAIAQGLTANQQVKAKQAQALAISKAERDKKKEEFYTWERGFKERQQTDRERVSSAKEKRDRSKDGKAETKAYLGSLQTSIKDTQFGVTNLETERKGILGRIEKLDAGQEFGLSEDAQVVKKRDLENDLKEVDGKLDVAQSDLRDINKEYRTLSGTSPKSDEAKPEETKAIPPELKAKFTADASMKKYKLGKNTPKGVEVLDSTGKVIGHYN